MKFDTPAATNPIDRLKVVGTPHARIDGPLKTTGTAPYAYERHDVVAEPAYGYIVGVGDRQGAHPLDRHGARPKPRPACIAVVTDARMPGRCGKGEFNTAKLLGGARSRALSSGDRAGRRRDVRAGARRRRAGPRRVCAAARARSIWPAAEAAAPSAPRAAGRQTASAISTRAFAAAPVTLDATYTTPDQSHAMMEPHATIAAWDGDQLTLWTSNQMIDWGKGDVAKTLGDARRTRSALVSPYIGGGFGGKLFVRADAVLAALGAQGGRPAGQGRAAAAR